MYGGPLFSPISPSLPCSPHLPLSSSPPSPSPLTILRVPLDHTTFSPSPLTSPPHPSTPLSFTPTSLPILLLLSPSPPQPPPPERKLRGLRDQPRVTRFDEPLSETRKMGEGDMPPTPPFSLSQDTSSRWKMLAGRLSEAVVKVRSVRGEECEG